MRFWTQGELAMSGFVPDIEEREMSNDSVVYQELQVDAVMKQDP